MLGKDMEGSDWESSFSQILNRTKHNLNRINSRYAPGVAPTLQDTSLLAPRGVINNENVHQNSLLLDRFSKTDTFLRTEGGGRGAAMAPAGPIDAGVLERLIRIEEHHRASESATNSRMSSLENALEMAVSRSDRSSQQMKDLEHSVMLLNTKLSAVNGFIELLQGENESKRTVISKMDNWIRQGEIWREELDGKVETLTKLTKALDRARTEQRELVAEHVTRYELEQLRDKLSVITQQSVAASLSAWHDKMEQSVRNVERQIALLRVGMTDAGRGSLGNDALLSPDEVAAALANPLPSELLLKGTVAHEVLQMQTQLEEKLESRLQLFLKDKVDTSHQSLNKDLHQQLHTLCAEMGLDYPEIELDAASIDATGAKARENYRIRLLEARKRSDEEVAELTRNVNRVTKDLATLQQSAASDQVHHTAVASNLDRKVEECLAVCGTSVRTVSERAAKLEDLVRDTELAIRTAVNDNKNELVERLGDLSREWSAERAALDRRLLVNERIAEDCLDRIKMSQSAVESYFKASPDIKRFHRSAELVAQLQTQLSGVQEEVRTTAVAVHKLEANASTKNEHLELRERVARLEPTVLEKLPDYMESTKRMVDLTMSMQSRLEKLDTLTTLQHNDLAATISRVSAVDVLATQLKSLTTVATEEVKRLSSTVAEMDAGTRKDINYLRDLTGSISSRVVAVEGKVAVMNKTYAADTVSTNNSLAKLSTICEDLQAHDATTQNTLVQLQFAIEAEHRETAERLAWVKDRLHLLRHVESTGGGGGGGDGGATGESKAIRIQFTTATGAADETEGSFGAEGSTMYFGSPAAPSAQLQQPSWSAAKTSPLPQPPHALAPTRTAADETVQPPVPPSAKAATRAGAAFLTEPSASSMSSPEKSATSNASARSWSPLPPAGHLPTAEEPASVRDTSAAPEPSVVQDSFLAARDYSYDEPQPPAGVDEFRVSSADAADADSLGDGDFSDEHSSHASDSHGDSGPSGRQSRGADINASASRIVGQSAFDMSMPSYVSHINSSGDVNQSSADYSYQRGHQEPVVHASASASGDHSPASSKLSVGSDDSVDQLNSAVDELVKHRDSVLSNEARSPSSSWSATQRAVGGGNASAMVTYNAAAAEEGSSSEEDDASDRQSERSARSDEFAHDSEGEGDEFAGGVAGHGAAGESRALGVSRTEMQEVEESSDSGDEGMCRGESADVDEASEDEFDHDGDETGGNDGQESAYTKSEATSVAGSYSQLDALPADTSRAAPTAAPAAARLENSWDDSFATGQSDSSPSKEQSRSTISGSSDSHASSGIAAKASPAKKPAFAIPSLNMGSLPVRATEADEIPSYRSTGRDLSQYAPGSSSRRELSDWDAESASQAASAAAPAATRVAIPTLDVSNLSGTSSAAAAPAMLVQDLSAAGSAVIVASEPALGVSGVDESTAGASISDTSISSSNVTASSNSFLTLSSASPQKATVAAPALAAASAAPAPAPVPVPAPAPRVVPAVAMISSATTSTASAARLDTSTASKKDSIKERLKNRLNKNKNSDAASVTSASAADEVMGFDD